jgi:predicted N-acetyltransferase YhbS
MFEILPEGPADGPAIDSLLDQAFGPHRRRKTVDRLRRGGTPLAELSIVARTGDRLAGSLRFWAVEIGSDVTVPALLLGPLAVAPERQGQGIGSTLVDHGLVRARAHGHRAVLLIGDPDYYGGFGFRADAAQYLTLPGPIDAARFLALELSPGALAGVRGPVRQPRRWLRAA